MKVLFIHTFYQYAGGEDIAVEAEARLLKEKGHEAEVLYFDNKELTTGKPALVAGLTSFYSSAARKRLAEHLRAFGPDVIHVHNLFFQASPSVLFAAKEQQVPVVLTLHNYRFICSNALLLRNGVPCELCTSSVFPLAGIKYKCYRSSHLQSALVTGITGLHKVLGTWRNLVHTYIALTPFGRQKILDSSLHLPGRQVVVVPNFVADGGTGAFPRQDFFLFVGRISAEKGVSYLLECFAALPQYRLVLAGDGPERESLEGQYGQCPNIAFYGRQTPEEVAVLMKQCQALVFPSVWYEGLPFTIIEAFSAGTPVIASRLGAMADLIKDGYNGLHFTAGDVQDLKAAVQKFAALGAGKEVLCRQARQTYEENYDPDSHYQAIMAVYQKAIGEYRK